MTNDETGFAAKAELRPAGGPVETATSWLLPEVRALVPSVFLQEPARLVGQWEPADLGGHIVQVKQGSRVVKTAIAAPGQLGEVVETIDRVASGRVESATVLPAAAAVSGPSPSYEQLRATALQVVIQHAALPRRLRGEGGPELEESIGRLRALLGFAPVPPKALEEPAPVDSLGALVPA